MFRVASVGRFASGLTHLTRFVVTVQHRTDPVFVEQRIQMAGWQSGLVVNTRWQRVRTGGVGGLVKIDEGERCFPFRLLQLLLQPLILTGTGQPVWSCPPTDVILSRNQPVAVVIRFIRALVVGIYSDKGGRPPSKGEITLILRLAQCRVELGWPASIDKMGGCGVGWIGQMHQKVVYGQGFTLRLRESRAIVVMVARHPLNGNPAGQWPDTGVENGTLVVDLAKQLVPIIQPATLLHQVPGDQNEIGIEITGSQHSGHDPLILIHRITGRRVATEGAMRSRLSLGIGPDHEAQRCQWIRGRCFERRFEPSHAILILGAR